MDVDLPDLIARGLLHRDLRTNRFDVHPIVRRYAYDRMAAPDRAGAHARLRDYFAAVPKPDKVRNMDDLAPVIELYHHTVRSGQYDEALALFRDRLRDATYYQFAAYQLGIDLLTSLFPDGEDLPPRLKIKRDQAWTLYELANSCGGNGQPHRAVELYQRQIEIDEVEEDKTYVAMGLSSMADDQIKLGALRAAEANLQRSLALLPDKPEAAIGHQGLGRLLSYRCAWAESETELAMALEMLKDHKSAQSMNWSYSACRELLRLRSTSGGQDLRPVSVGGQSAISAARRALEVADEAASFMPIERYYIRAHWLLGAAYRVAGELGDAERHLHEALERCRRVNMVEAEGDILIDFARLRIATAAADEAQRLAGEALVIADRCGYVLQGADAHLVLAQLAKNRGDVKALREHAEEALRLATCDGPPDYTYKAAYDEATALLR
jgi:tetratricopeptide (TPR) repeat protein